MIERWGLNTGWLKATAAALHPSGPVYFRARDVMVVLQGAGDITTLFLAGGGEVNIRASAEDVMKHLE